MHLEATQISRQIAGLLLQRFAGCVGLIELRTFAIFVRYREALEKYGEFVKLSKELSKIPTDAPVTLSLLSR